MNIAGQLGLFDAREGYDLQRALSPNSTPDDRAGLTPVQIALHTSGGIMQVLKDAGVPIEHFSEAQFIESATPTIVISLSLGNPGESTEAIQKMQQLLGTIFGAVTRRVQEMTPLAPGFERCALVKLTTLLEGQAFQAGFKKAYKFDSVLQDLPKIRLAICKQGLGEGR